MKTDSPAYRIIVVALLSLNFGIVFFDRNALNFLMPFVQPDLKLTNTEVGLLASALSLTWALSGIFVGAASDKAQKRKAYLVVAIFAFSLCSALSGLASSFLFLLATRLLMGAAEGPILPISQSLTANIVPPERRGLAMGVMQNFGSNLLGSFVAPVLLVALATWVGWRYAFFLAGVPGVITGLLIWRLIEEPRGDAAIDGKPRMTLAEAYSHRNILICTIMAALLVSYLVIAWSFLPLFLTQARAYDPGVMGWLMGTLGISATVGSFLIPGLSDVFGRRPVMILVPFAGVILPLGAMYFHGSPWLLAVIFFFGWALNGCFPLFMATIPSETVDARFVATTLGLVMGAGEVLGGVGGPAIAGIAADRFGLDAPLWIMFGLAAAAGVAAFGLTETAPGKRQTAPALARASVS